MSEIPIMVMPWHRPDPCKPLRMQTAAAFKSTYMDYLATLRLDSPPLEIPLSCIAGTIGPASNNIEMLVDLMSAGMSIAVVPLALGTRQDQLDTIANIRTATSAFSNMRDMVYPLAIAVQTKGPGLRLGGLFKDVPVTLPIHHKLTLTTDKAWRTKGTEHYIYINFPEMHHVLTEGDILLVGSGTVILQVEYIDKSECKCMVAGGGQIHSFMAVSVPDVPLNLPPLTDEDVDDLMMAAEMGVDVVVASHSQTDELIRQIRRILDDQEGGSGIKIWAQIESNQGLKNLKCILEVADAIVFSRISLLQDIPPEKLFLAQKIVISTCNKEGVPVFVSSHFLPTMQAAASPSIAELYDVTGAVLDGTDGFLLRNTVSHGKNPDLTVKTLSQVCVEAEAAQWHHQTFNYLNAHAPAPVDPTHSIAIAAVEASLKSCATLILLCTTSGRSAQLVARYRPRCPIIAVTRYGQVARQLSSWRAVIPLHYVDPPLPEWPREVDVRFQYGIEYAKHKGIVRPGDVMVLLNGWRQGAGFTNTIRVVYASDTFPWVYPHKLPDNIPSDETIRQQEEGESASRTGTGGGEPSGSSRVVTIVESPTSLSAKVKAMEEDYKSIASDKSREIHSKMLSSLESLKKESLRRNSLELGEEKANLELLAMYDKKTESKTTRGSGEVHATKVSTATRKSKEGTVLESPSVVSAQKANTKNPTVVSEKTATVMSVKNPTVVSEKTATVMSVKNPTVVSEKTATVMSVKNPTVVSEKTATVMSVKNPTVVSEKPATVTSGKTPTVVTTKRSLEGKKRDDVPQTVEGKDKE